MDRMRLQLLESKMSLDPKSHESELERIYKNFNLNLEHLQFGYGRILSDSGFHSAEKEGEYLGVRALLLARMTKFYPKHLSAFPNQLAHLMRANMKSLPRSMRSCCAKGLIVLTRDKILPISEMLPLFMELQTLDDKKLKILAASFVRRMEQNLNA